MAPQAAEWGLELRLGFELTPTVELLEADLSRYALGRHRGRARRAPVLGPTRPRGTRGRARRRVRRSAAACAPGASGRRHLGSARHAGLRGTRLAPPGERVEPPRPPRARAGRDRLVPGRAGPGTASSRPTAIGSRAHRSWTRRTKLVKARIGETATPLFDGSALNAKPARVTSAEQRPAQPVAAARTSGRPHPARDRHGSRRA